MRRPHGASQIASDERPDIILLDVMMPGMDGFETCRRLKADPVTRHIPVVLVTALDGREDKIKGLDAGADDFVTKPIDDVILFARVKLAAAAQGGHGRAARARGKRPPAGRRHRRRRTAARLGRAGVGRRRQCALQAGKIVAEQLAAEHRPTVARARPGRGPDRGARSGRPDDRQRLERPSSTACASWPRHGRPRPRGGRRSWR
jgi:two-component system cell cycle response regulator